MKWTPRKYLHRFFAKTPGCYCFTEIALFSSKYISWEPKTLFTSVMDAMQELALSHGAKTFFCVLYSGCIVFVKLNIMGYKNFNFQVKGTPCKSFLCFTTTTPG
jgi:hypothetical protein